MSTSRRTKRIERKRIRSRGTALVAVAAAAFGVAATPRDAAAQIACGGRIGPGEEVVLPASIECDGPLEIVVQGPAVLDLNGFSILCRDRDGDGRVPFSGLVLTGSGAVVRNGLIHGCIVGLFVQGEGGHHVEDVRVVSSREDGIRISSARNALIGSNVLLSGHDGVDVFGAGNLLVGNASTGNGENGFRVTEKSVLRQNIASGNPSAGFLVARQGSLIVGNRAVGNSDGFLVLGQKNRFVGNEAEGNATGVYLDGPAAKNVLSKNETSDNEFAGFFVLGSGNKISRNRAEGNDFGVFVIPGADGTVVKRNVVVGSKDTDLVDQGADVDCGANRWRRNEFGSSNHPCIR